MEREHPKKKADKKKGPQGREDTVSFNFLLQAQAQKAVHHAVSSFFLGRQGGAVVIGGTDPRYYVGKIHYHPALKRVSGNWVLEMDSFKAHGVEVCKPKCLGLIDSGTTAMVVPCQRDANSWLARRPNVVSRGCCMQGGGNLQHRRHQVSASP